MMKKAILSVTILLLLSICGFLSADPSYAQDNLLQNGGFNESSNYRAAMGRPDFNFAPGWDGWQTNSPSTESWMNIDAIAFPHTGSLRTEGDASQNIGRGDATFTAAAFQVVDGIAEGTTLRASVWVFQENDEGSDARTRIGIGSNVGGNPFASGITWSPWLTALRSWQQISVEATVPAGSVTVFVYSTQSLPNSVNQMYYDDAQLIAVGSGEPDVGGDEEATSAPPTATPQPYAPFVDPQEADESGRIEHVVRSGDTLAAIAVAYGVPINQIRELNDLSSDLLQVGQVLLIQESSPPTEAPPPDESTEEMSPESTDEMSAQSDADGGFASPTPQEIAQQPTDTPTEEMTEEATEEPTPVPTDTPDVTPTPTEVPPTPTDAPPAPVEEGSDVDPLSLETAVCVLMFDDTNQNTLQDVGEPLLAGGTITLTNNADDRTQETTTDGESEPFCFTELERGSYTVVGQPPDGYGMVNSSSLIVNVQAGQQFTVRFAAAEGVEVAMVPSPDGSTVDSAPDIVEEAPADETDLRSVAGILVLAAAGVVLVGGIGVAVFFGRR